MLSFPFKCVDTYALKGTQIILQHSAISLNGINSLPPKYLAEDFQHSIEPPEVDSHRAARGRGYRSAAVHAQRRRR